ncbi:MAG: Calx-beta domain-containing protein, partial [Thermoanaerobaculia bacterium]
MVTRRPFQIAGLVAWVVLGSAAARAQYDDPGPGPEPGVSCQSGDIQVNAQTNLRFSPDDVTIQAGQVVCFRNASTSIPHNVHAPGFMQCAGACDPNPSTPSASPVGVPATNWVTRYKFDQAGTINYQCDQHVSMGMTGRVVVQGAASPGALSFTTSNFSVSEGGGNATINVRRTGGDDGAVSVQYATANGSATAGSDYTAKTGTLSWPDNDDNNKSFTVAITNDTADEANETVQLSLSNPTGGATLGSPSSATLTINDNDDSGPGPSAPAAPSNLQAAAISTSEIRLTWTDNANNETAFLIERRPLGGTFTPIGTAPANATEFTAGGLPSSTFFDFRIRATNAAGNSAYSNVAGASTDATPGPCLETGGAICINNDRFLVEVDWRTATNSGIGTGVPLSFAPDSGVLYFFSPSNLEMLIKVLDACPLNNRYWVFFAATTNVEFTLTVTDTKVGKVKTYFNPLNTPAPPVQDTAAFATC